MTQAKYVKSKFEVSLYFNQICIDSDNKLGETVMSKHFRGSIEPVEEDPNEYNASFSKEYDISMIFHFLNLK